MNWILVLAIAVVSDALRIFIDNYVSDVYFKEKGAVAQKIISGVALPIVGIVTIILNQPDLSQADPVMILFLVCSGIFNSIAGIPYYKALEIDDSTNIGIFFQFSPILYLIFNLLFFGESFTAVQLVGATIILIAPALVIFTARKNSRKTRIRAAILAFISILFYVLSGLLFTQATHMADIGIFNEIGMVIIVKGLADLVIIGSRLKWRRRLTKVIASSKGKVILPISAGLVAKLTQEFSYRIGLVIAPSIAIASAASDSVEPAAIFFMGLVLTLIWPKFGREKLQKKTVLVHLVATVVVIFGIVLMQV